MIQRITRVSN